MALDGYVAHFMSKVIILRFCRQKLPKRPFIAVKRCHETTKTQIFYVSPNESALFRRLTAILSTQG